MDPNSIYKYQGFNTADPGALPLFQVHSTTCSQSSGVVVVDCCVEPYQPAFALSLDPDQLMEINGDGLQRNENIIVNNLNCFLIMKMMPGRGYPNGQKLGHSVLLLPYHCGANNKCVDNSAPPKQRQIIEYGDGFNGLIDKMDADIKSFTSPSMLVAMAEPFKYPQ